MERAVGSQVVPIRAEEYSPFCAQQHLYLVGNLKKPNPHPFFRDSRVELALCFYDAGDDGRFHWHREVTEYEIVLEGVVGYTDAAGGATQWFRAGDCRVVPPGVCVKRLVPEASRTVAVKVPSSAENVHCSACSRECVSRQQAFEGA